MLLDILLYPRRVSIASFIWILFDLIVGADERLSLTLGPKPSFAQNAERKLNSVVSKTKHSSNRRVKWNIPSGRPICGCMFIADLGSKVFIYLWMMNNFELICGKIQYSRCSLIYVRCVMVAIWLALKIVSSKLFKNSTRTKDHALFFKSMQYYLYSCFFFNKVCWKQLKSWLER